MCFNREILVAFAKKYKIEIWIFCLAFGVRFFYALLVQYGFGSHGFLAYSDITSFYLQIARNLVYHHAFSWSTASPYIPDAFRTPLYPFFLAFFVWLKIPFLFAVAIQNVVAGIISVIIYRIAVTAFSSHKAGLFAAIMTAIEPISIYWNNLLMSDYFFALFFISAFYSFFLRKYYVVGLLLGLGALTKPVGSYFLLLFLLVMIILERGWLRKNFGVVLRTVVITLIIFFATLSPWFIRNRLVCHTWQFSSASWYALYEVVAQDYASSMGFILQQPPASLLNSGYCGISYYNFSVVPFYKDNFKDIVLRDPLSYTFFHLSHSFQSWWANPYKYLVNFVLKVELGGLFEHISPVIVSLVLAVGGIFWKVMYFFMFLGFFIRKHRWKLILFSMMLAVNFLTAGVLEPPGSDGSGADSSRYLLPFMPLIFLFAGLGFQYASSLFFWKKDDTVGIKSATKLNRSMSFGENNIKMLDKLLYFLRMRLIARELSAENTKPRLLVDFGCGYSARLLFALMKRFSSIEKASGIDITVNGALSTTKLNLIGADLNKILPLDSESSDTIVSTAVLEHLQNPVGAAREMYRVLKPGGLLLLTTPAPMARHVIEFLAFRLHLIDPAEVRDHKRYFSSDELVEMFRGVGFGEVKIKHFQFGLNTLLKCVK